MKNIVICCDGTGNEFGRNNTNVVLTYMLAEKDEHQVVCYDPGSAPAAGSTRKTAAACGRRAIRRRGTVCNGTSRTPIATS